MVGRAQELVPQPSGNSTGDAKGGDHGATRNPSSPATAVDPDRRSYQPMSARPALIVLGIAVFIVVLGTVASGLITGNSPDKAVNSVTIAGGIGVRLTPATTAMKSIVGQGQPPADILGNLAVPAGSTVVRTVNSDGGVAQFDRTVYFTSGLSKNELVDAFHAILPKLGWKIIYTGNRAQLTANETEVLAKQGSNDGFYWESGVVVSPTTSAGVTPYSVELYELPDDNN
jgi:hypothetical protein